VRAEYPGLCDLCDDKIRPGDDIRRASEAEDSWVHVDCMTRLDADVNKVLGQLGVSRPRCTCCADLLAKDGACPNCGG
jgi:hypothetical protein